MNVVCIVQARMGSERLPGKVLKPIVGKTMLERVIERLKQANSINRVVVATSFSPLDNAIVNHCEKMGIDVFRGSELNVLERYYLTATACNADIVVRVTADCPLVDFDGIDDLIKEIKRSSLDYIAFSNDQIPRGLTGEVFTYEALKKTFESARLSYEHEHVTIYMYEHPEKFHIKYAEPPTWLKRPEIRLTVDTDDDLKLIRKIYESIEIEKPCNIDLKEVLALLDKNPELAQINGHIHQKDPKSKLLDSDEDHQ